MIVTQEKKFTPVVITLESEEEARIMLMSLNYNGYAISNTVKTADQSKLEKIGTDMFYALNNVLSKKM